MTVLWLARSSLRDHAGGCANNGNRTAAARHGEPHERRPHHQPRVAAMARQGEGSKN
jgi:hypothetical protein